MQKEQLEGLIPIVRYVGSHNMASIVFRTASLLKRCSLGVWRDSRSLVEPWSDMDIATPPTCARAFLVKGRGPAKKEVTVPAIWDTVTSFSVNSIKRGKRFSFLR